MLSLLRARSLLLAASTIERLTDIARELGFAGAARILDAPTCAALGIPAEVSAVRICRGTGSSRALTIEADSSDIRTTLTRAASQLAARAPQLLWLIIAIDSSRRHLAIATFSHERHPPRVRALLCDRAHVLDSDAETLSALASARGLDDLLAHTRWMEILGREALTRRFYSRLEHVVHSLAISISNTPAEADARELSVLYVSRLLFLSFLETQGWLNDDHGFLANGFADCMANGGRYHQRVLLPLFFGTLNTPPRSRSRRALAFGSVPFLNGGLFSRNSLERRTARVQFPDESMGELYGDLLCRHRFSPREDSTDWSEAAIDPEMLGKSFESLMASADRKSSGAFYTPQSLVERVVRDALAEALRGANVSGTVVEDPQLLARVRALKVLDPACGSGAFLVFALSELTALAVASGDKRARGEITRSILVGSIFGVDSNPMAVWLCELRLWLAMVMEQRHQGISAVTPLPNLDRQIRVGDTLAGGAFDGGKCVDRRPISRVRARYTRSQGPRKRSLGRILDRAERASAVESVTAEIERNEHARRELVMQARARDLFGSRPRPSADTRRSLADLRAALRELRRNRANLRAGSALPFSFATHFPDVAVEGGFGLVAANPPWVRLHRVPPALRVRLRAEYRVFRGSAWEAGCQAAKAGPGFGSQVDVAALFTERSLDLLRPNGIAALLLPAKLWSSLAGGGVRTLVAERSQILGLEDLTDAPASFDAAVYPSLLLARKSLAPPDGSSAAFAVHRRKTRFTWRATPRSIALDETTGSPWILAPPGVRAAFDSLRYCGVPLGQTRLGSPLLGVKSGCNEAFVVTRVGDGVDSWSCIRSGDATGEIETAMLRPAIRGEHVAAWLTTRSASRVVWTHGPDGNPLPSLPAGARRWLHQYRARLEARTDARSTERWWSLFRTDGAACDRPRVVWADVGKRPRAAVLAAGDNAVPLNSCYVLKCQDYREALTLTAIFNSDLAAAWLDLLAEPARGGYHRYLGWTMAMLPLPRDWAGACAALPQFAEGAMSGAVDSRALLEAVLRAYGIRFADIAPLLAWTG